MRLFIYMIASFAYVQLHIKSCNLLILQIQMYLFDIDFYNRII